MKSFLAKTVLMKIALLVGLQAEAASVKDWVRSEALKQAMSTKTKSEAGTHATARIQGLVSGLEITTQPAPQPPPSPTPIRTAKARISAARMQMVRNGTTIDVKIDKLCEANVNVDVYDFRSMGNPQQFPQISTQEICKATIDGAPGRILAVSVLGYESVDYHGDGFTTDVKTAAVGVFFVPDQGANLGLFAFTFAGSKDLGQKSILLFPHAPNKPDPQDANKYNDGLSAIVDFED